MFYFFEYIQVPRPINISLESRTLFLYGSKIQDAVWLGERLTVSLINPSLLKIEFVIKTPGRQIFKKTFNNHFALKSKIESALFGIRHSYSMQIVLNGVGFRLAVKGIATVLLTLGFSHDVSCKVPEGITIRSVTETAMICAGFSNQKLMNFANAVQRCRVPGTYDNRGVLIHGKERTLRKKNK